MENLGDIVSRYGVKEDRNKIKSIKEWKIHKNIKHLQGFLRLIGYCCKFVNNFMKIAAPLTTLLKKDAFSWNPKETKTFQHIKEVMYQALVLTTLDFTKTFIVECDSSGNKIGVILMQEGGAITFENCQIKGKYLQNSIYKNEILETQHALNKCALT